MASCAAMVMLARRSDDGDPRLWRRDHPPVRALVGGLPVDRGGDPVAERATGVICRRVAAGGRPRGRDGLVGRHAPLRCAPSGGTRAAALERVGSGHTPGPARRRRGGARPGPEGPPTSQGRCSVCRRALPGRLDRLPRWPVGVAVAAALVYPTLRTVLGARRDVRHGWRAAAHGRCRGMGDGHRGSGPGGLRHRPVRRQGAAVGLVRSSAWAASRRG